MKQREKVAVLLKKDHVARKGMKEIDEKDIELGISCEPEEENKRIDREDLKLSVGGCFINNCNERAAYVCKCNGNQNFTCPSHLGIHCTAKGLHSPESLLEPISSDETNPLLTKAQSTIDYLNEVQTAFLLTSESIINSIKSEMQKFTKCISQQQEILRKLIQSIKSGNRQIHRSDKEKLRNFKFFNLKRALSEIDFSLKSSFEILVHGTAVHLLLDVTKTPVEQLPWIEGTMYPEMSKADQSIKCCICGEVRGEDEFNQNDLDLCCLICSGVHEQWHPPSPHVQSGEEIPPLPQCPPHIRPVCAFVAYL